jgi:hypothetical protein
MQAYTDRKTSSSGRQLRNLGGEQSDLGQFDLGKVVSAGISL